jgi:hypothetical protein
VFGWLFRKPPTVPKHLTVEDVRYWLDGGTTEVIGADQDGKRRVIRLTQYLFPQWGGVGWLYLDRYKVPRRSEIESAIVELLKACLTELKSRPQECQPDEKTVAEALGERAVVIFGSPDLAATANMTNAQRMVFRVEQMLEYIESSYYGKALTRFL